MAGGYAGRSSIKQYGTQRGFRTPMQTSTGGAGGGGSGSLASSVGGGGGSGVSKVSGSPDSRVTSLFDQIIKQYQPGGDFGAHEKALLGRARTKSLASSYQNAVSSGLSGTSVPEAHAAKFDEEIGSPTMLGIEKTRVQALINAMLQKAGYMERATQPRYFGGGGSTGGVVSGSSAPMSEFAGSYQPTQMPTMLPYYQEMAARNQALGTSPINNRTTHVGQSGSLSFL